MVGFEDADTADPWWRAMVEDIRGDMGVAVVLVDVEGWIEGADVSWGGVLVGGNVRNNCLL